MVTTRCQFYQNTGNYEVGFKPSLFSGRTGLKIVTIHLLQCYFILINREQ